MMKAKDQNILILPKKNLLNIGKKDGFIIGKETLM